PLQDPALVPQQISERIGVEDTDDASLTAAIAAAMVQQAALLVLDNCEHLPDACARLVAALLDRCPRLVVLATSREPLYVRGEQVYPVSPLAVPKDAAPAAAPSQRTAAANAAPDEDAATARRFVERARALRPDFALGGDAAAAVAVICRRLDGLPLAIEIVAAQVRLLSPSQIAARLNRRLQAVVGNVHNADPRHRTLRALIDWSYESLSGAEPTVLRRLAVFSGGWSLEAAEAVCGGAEVPTDAMLGTLGALVDKSLVVADTTAETARYHLLESIREYGFEQLAAAVERDQVGRRHFQFYAALAEAAAAELRGTAQLAWLRRLEVEHNNLRTALQWAVEHQELEAALGLARALAPHWDSRGHLSEGRRWLESLLEMQTAACPPKLHAQALLAAGRLAHRQNQLEQAVALLEQSVSAARTMVDVGLIAETLVYLGAVRRRQGDFDQSARLLEGSLALYRAVDDEAGTALALMSLGVAARFQGDAARSVRLLDESLSRYRRCGDVRWTAITLTMLGRSLLALGNAARAVGFIRAGLAGHRAVGDRSFMIFGLLDMAAVLATQARPGRAAQLLGAVQSLREALGAPQAPANVQVYEEVVQSARRVLGEAGFAAAVAEGAVLPLETAVALAHEETPSEVACREDSDAPH
ncbi:MAG TPA: tetratricopeptide repeat protein, partial [Dehalococcoidia bacterium]|nr:tetratricopeptide repeat protein [Dehalococcoidia bacterium]